MCRETSDEVHRYWIKCEDCEASYVGETGRTLESRLSEHRRPSSTSSEVSRHIHLDHPDHRVDMDKVKIVDVEPRKFERGVREAIQILLKRPTLNRDVGRYELPNIWNGVLRAQERRGGDPVPGPPVTAQPRLWLSDPHTGQS